MPPEVQMFVQSNSLHDRGTGTVCRKPLSPTFKRGLAYKLQFCRSVTSTSSSISYTPYSKMAPTRCGAVRCGAVRCGAVRCGAVRCCAVLYCAVQWCSVRCGAVLCGAVLCGAVRCGAVQCSAVRCGAVRCDAMRCGAVQCCTVQCSDVLCGVVLSCVFTRVCSVQRNSTPNIQLTFSPIEYTHSPLPAVMDLVPAEDRIALGLYPHPRHSVVKNLVLFKDPKAWHMKTTMDYLYWFQINRGRHFWNHPLSHPNNIRNVLLAHNELRSLSHYLQKRQNTVGCCER